MVRVPGLGFRVWRVEGLAFRVCWTWGSPSGTPDFRNHPDLLRKSTGDSDAACSIQ